MSQIFADVNCLRSTGFRRSQWTATSFQKWVPCPWPHQDVSNVLWMKFSIFQYLFLSLLFIFLKRGGRGRAEFQLACLVKSVVKNSLHLWIFWSFPEFKRLHFQKEPIYFVMERKKNIMLLKFYTLHLTIQVQYRKYWIHTTVFYWKEAFGFPDGLSGFPEN